jgi:hypothetical protein
MGNVKRVLIFSPNLGIQNELGNLVLQYFSSDFRLFHPEVQIQKFRDIHESYNLKSQIGLGGEVLVIFDIVSLESHVLKKERENLRVLLKAEKRCCEDKKIPYLDYYKNQILRKDTLDDLRRQFYPRLEARDLFEY